jgi:hypothetical protein
MISGTSYQLFKLINMFFSHIRKNSSNSDQTKQWKSFLMDMKSQTIALTNVLGSTGFINHTEMQVIKKIILAKSESLSSSPDAIRK